jgi:hypothetical protein
MNNQKVKVIIDSREYVVNVSWTWSFLDNVVYFLDENGKQIGYGDILNDGDFKEIENRITKKLKKKKNQ